MAKPSFFRRMAEEKGIINDEFSIEVHGMLHFMNVEEIIELIERAPESEQKVIKDTFSQIDFQNGDLMHYIKFLAKSVIQTQFV